MRGAARAFNAAGSSPSVRPFRPPSSRPCSSSDGARVNAAASSFAPAEEDELETACDCARAGLKSPRESRHRAKRNVCVIRRTPFTASRFGGGRGAIRRGVKQEALRTLTRKPSAKGITKIKKFSGRKKSEPAVIRPVVRQLPPACLEMFGEGRF